MEDEKTMELWAETEGIEISNLGNSKDPITQYRGRNVIRKSVTIKKKVQIKGVEKTLTKEIQKRYQVARLVLECFPPPYMMQCSGQGNFLGRGTVVWKDGNSLNCTASNLMWKWSGPGWTEAQTLKLQGYIKKAMEELSLTEKYPSYYLKLT